MSHVRDEKKSIDDLKKLPIIGRQPTNEKEEKFLREVCDFEFYNLEEPGISVRFPYGNSKNQHNFTLFHGGKYTLPRFIARHLESCKTPIWKWRPDGLGAIHKEKVGYAPRFRMSQKFGE